MRRIHQRRSISRGTVKRGLTKHFYVMNGGGCRQMFTTKGRVDEFPYSTTDALRCHRRGGHPHRGQSVQSYLSRRRRIKVQHTRGVEG